MGMLESWVLNRCCQPTPSCTGLTGTVAGHIPALYNATLKDYSCSRAMEVRCDMAKALIRFWGTCLNAAKPPHGTNAGPYPVRMCKRDDATISIVLEDEACVVAGG